MDQFSLVGLAAVGERLAGQRRISVVVVAGERHTFRDGTA
jgi:hypothetical protein